MDDYRDVMRKLREIHPALAGVWAVLGPSVPRYWDEQGPEMEWREALRILREAADSTHSTEDSK